MIKWCMIGLMQALIFFNTYAQPKTEDLVAELSNYWEAQRPSDEKRAVKKVLGLEPEFDDVYALLKKGRQYSGDVERGFLEWQHSLNGYDYYTLVHIPKAYDPAKKYMVYIHLHGGVGSSPQKAAYKFINRNDPDYETRDYINIYPSSWSPQPWWHMFQYESIGQILERLKRLYNIDENRIHIGGISDGGTGTFYMANINPTPWASYTSFIGNFHGLKVLSDNQVYASNLKYKPFLVINTENDPLFSPAMVLPYINLLREVKADLQFEMLKGYGHDLKWFPDHRAEIKRFIQESQRDPFADSIFWETEDLVNKGRNHWVIINRLGSVSSESEIPDINKIPIINNQAFPRDSISGRITVFKQENTVHVRTQGVRKFSLLLSPDHFDLDQQVVVYVNNEISYQGIVKKRLATLFKWNRKDQDRSMLFSNELNFTVGRKLKAQN